MKNMKFPFHTSKVYIIINKGFMFEHEGLDVIYGVGREIGRIFRIIDHISRFRFHIFFVGSPLKIGMLV
jgi:hypothetical protein